MNHKPAQSASSITSASRDGAPEMQANVNDADLEMARKLGISASRLQEQRTGHSPTSVSVVLQNDTLVVTLHDALTHAEKDLAKLPDGATSVQDYHRRLFASDSDGKKKGDILLYCGRARF